MWMFQDETVQGLPGSVPLGWHGTVTTAWKLCPDSTDKYGFRALK